MLPSIKETSIAFDIATMTILLVDDVIFTGRTTKAALETLTSFGRPKAIRLFVLVDRAYGNCRYNRITAEFRIQTGIKDNIEVVLSNQPPAGDSVILITAE